MNLYQPHLVRIEEKTDETADTQTYKLVFVDPEVAAGFDFKTGQFGEYSVFGAGECTFCIASPPTRKGYIEASFKTVGKATRAMRRLNVGDTMGFRGPYGNFFPLDRMEGQSLVFIAGGIGLAPVRSVIWNALDLRDRFKDVTIVYGARSVGDLVYKRELAEWARRPDVRFYQCVDPGGETPDWQDAVCFVPSLVEKVAPSSQDAFAIVCGPPIMITFTLPLLEKLGFAPERIYTTLENRMKCGLGKCGRCNIGSVYVCKDGPVFTAAQLKALPRDL
ncbi:MAG: FAD/NAD(P)-binding protein [Deltaproteobacteria bacterium]|nr:FAD/NAD(P)-binding protein [Deltaproteobacteria bacterium]